MGATAMTPRTRQGARHRLDQKHASECVVFCRTHVSASSLIRRRELHARVRGSRFLAKDPVEGGSANDYDYANGDPCNSYDLDGRAAVVPIVVAGIRIYGYANAIWNGYKCQQAVRGGIRLSQNINRYLQSKGRDAGHEQIFRLMRHSGYFHDMAHYCSSAAAWAFGTAIAARVTNKVTLNLLGG